jgi:Arf-GAP with SH3 domain, ANK repeat and PH domain-containing protein
MGNVSSRPDEGAALYLRDQTRCQYVPTRREEHEAHEDAGIVTISSLSVTNSRRRTVLNVVPNAFPATRVSATRDLGDNSVVEYVQV